MALACIKHRSGPLRSDGCVSPSRIFPIWKPQAADACQILLSSGRVRILIATTFLSTVWRSKGIAILVVVWLSRSGHFHIRYYQCATRAESIVQCSLLSLSSVRSGHGLRFRKVIRKMHCVHACVALQFGSWETQEQAHAHACCHLVLGLTCMPS